MKSEKAVDSSVFETSEETITSNSVNVYYSNAPSFKKFSEKSIEEETARNKKSAGTCHPICESVGIQYDESHFENIRSPKVRYETVTICGLPQNGSGETRTVFDCNKMLAFDDMLEKFKNLQVEHVKLMGITAELVKTLQSSILGQSERFCHLREKCKEDYPDLFVLMEKHEELIEPVEKENNAEVLYLTVEPKTSQVKLEITRSVSDTCLEKKKSMQEMKIERKESCKSLENVMFNDKSVRIREGGTNKQENGFFDIDYGKLKSDLINADDAKKMLILQALRWVFQKTA